MTTYKFLARTAASSTAVALLIAGGALVAQAQTNASGTNGTYTTPGGTTMNNTSGTSGSTTGTGSTTGSGGTSATPGAPNTGAGGDMAANLALLGTAAVAAIGGAAYLARQRNTVRV